MIGNACTIARDLTLSGGDVTIAGTVGRDIQASAGTLKLTDSARVGRNLNAHTSQPVIAAGAVIEGVKRIQAPARPHRRGHSGLPRAIFMLVMGFIVGLLTLALLPRLSVDTQTMLRAHPWGSMLTGFIVLIVTPIAGIILLCYY